jgi:hypothetical protein
MHCDPQDICVPGQVGPPVPAEPDVPALPGDPVVLGFVHPAITRSANPIPGAKIIVFIPIDIPGRRVSDLPTAGAPETFLFPVSSDLAAAVTATASCRDMGSRVHPTGPACLFKSLQGILKSTGRIVAVMRSQVRPGARSSSR